MSNINPIIQLNGVEYNLIYRNLDTFDEANEVLNDVIAKGCTGFILYASEIIIESRKSRKYKQKYYHVYGSRE